MPLCEVRAAVPYRAYRSEEAECEECWVMGRFSYHLPPTTYHLLKCKEQPNCQTDHSGQQNLRPVLPQQHPAIGGSGLSLSLVAKRSGKARSQTGRKPANRADYLFLALAVGNQNRRGIDPVGGLIEFLAQGRRDVFHRAVNFRFISDGNEDGRTFQSDARHGAILQERVTTASGVSFPACSNIT